MKPLYILAFSLLYAFTLSAQTEWKIHGAQKQPQWVMPFFFEDANGEKDTVWLGFHEDANNMVNAYDPEFNEWQRIDTTRFNVVTCLNCSSPLGTTPKDSAYKVDVQSFPYPEFSLGFINGRLPITMKWDDSVLNSSNLPSVFFPDISPRPKARIDLNCINTEPPYEYCRTSSPHHPPIVLTNYTVFEFFETSVYSDSFFFEGSGNINPALAVSIRLAIVPHNNALYTSINQGATNLEVKVYPNPFSDQLLVETARTKCNSFLIVDLFGHVWLTESTQNQAQVIFNVSELPAGIYILKALSGNTTFTKRIVKRN